MKKMYHKMILFILTVTISGIANAQLQIGPIGGGGCQQMTPNIQGSVDSNGDGTCTLNVTAKDNQGAGPSDFTYTWKVNGLTIVNNGTDNNFSYPADAGQQYNVTVIFTIPGSTPLCTATGFRSFTAPDSCGDDDIIIPPNPTCPSNGIVVNNVECTTTGGGDASANWNVNASHVDYIVWRYSIGPHSNVPLGTTTGNTNGLHQVNWNLPQANQPIPGTWDNYNLVVKGKAYLVNGVVCQEFYKIITLDCPGGGGGTGNQRIGVFPNPTKGKFNVQNNTNVKISEIIVKDTYGRVVIANLKSPNQELDLTDQVEGIYFIETVFEDGTVETKKLLIKK